MENQSEFLFADGETSQLIPPDLRTEFYGDVSSAWNLPLGKQVKVDLRDHDFSELQGCLELSRAPDLPLNPRHTLALRIGTIEF